MSSGSVLIRRATCLLVLLVLAACASAAVRQVPDGERLSESLRARWRAAADALDRGDAQSALTLVEPLLAVEPWHVPSHVLRQDALGELGRTHDADEAYRAEAARAPRDAVRALLAARNLPREGGAREAAYRAAAASDAANPWASIALAYELSRNARAAEDEAQRQADAGFADKAEAAEKAADAAAREAETLARGVASRWDGLAAAQGALADVLLAPLERGRSRAKLFEALEAAERARELDPGSAAVWERAGRARRAASGDEAAAEAFRSAVAIAPRHGIAWKNLGRVLLDLRRDAQARDALATAASLLPNDVETAVDLGVAAFRTGDLAAAEAALVRAAAVAPTDPRPFQALALTRARRGDRAGAAAAMERYLENGGTDRDGAKRFVAEMRGLPLGSP